MNTFFTKLGYKIFTAFVALMLVAALPMQVAHARPLAATVQFAMPLNADVIINRTGGVTDTTQVGIDGDAAASMCYLTQTAATNYNGNPNGIPDNGFIAANAFHPAVQLAANNADNGNNARKIAPAGPLTFTIDVPDDNYYYMHIFGVTGSGASSFSLTFNYSDATSTTTSTVNLRDWFDDFTQTATEYYLLDGLDRMGCNVTGYQNSNDPAIFGHRFAPNVNKTLQTVTVTVSNLTGGERAIFFGAVGESAPTVTINQGAGQVDPTNVSPITFDVVFSETVTGFIGSDVNLSGSTTPGTLTASVIGSGTNYTVSVSGMTGAGNVVATIPANVAQNAAGIGNQASTSMDNQVTYTTLATTTTTITSDVPDPSEPNQSVNVVVTVTGGLATPTGTVDITGADANCVITLAGGTGNCNVTFTSLGAKILTATYSGDATHLTSTDIEAHTVALGTTTTTITSDAPDSSEPNQSVNVVVTVTGGLATPTGTVNITGADTNCVITLAGGTGNCNVNFTSLGSKTLTATYNGDGTHATSTDTEPHTVALGAVTVTIDSDTPDPSDLSQNVNVVVTVTGGSTTPTGTVDITGADTNCSITLAAGTGSCNVSFISTGAKTLTATYNGDASHSTATDTEDHTANNTPLAVVSNGVNTDAGGVNMEFQVLTSGPTQISITFSKDVNNSSGGSGADDVTNPANYLLVRDLGDTADFQTVSCNPGAVVPADTKIDVTGVVYDSGTHIATFTVNGGLPLSNGNYRLYICGTTSITDLFGVELAGDGTTAGTDFIRNFIVSISGGGGGNRNGSRGNKSDAKTIGNLLIPVTGFTPNQVTLLPIQPAGKAYKPLDEIRIEIPTLGIDFPIVGVSLSKNKWDLTWLNGKVGYLEGSAYPTFSGNTVLTAHVIDANNNLGPFSDIKGMQLGQKIYIHAYGQVYVYQVQENRKLLPTSISTVFKHEEYDWVTLVTCEDYNVKAKTYNYRRMVRAVLISVIPEK
jgi:LPXTG-site transpeptidase (sortase) family protein